MANDLALGIVIGATVSGTVGRAFQSLDQRATQLGATLNNVQLGRRASSSVIQYRNRLEQLRNLQQQFGVSNTNLWGQIARTERQLRDAERAAQSYGLNIGDIVRENNRLVQSEQRVQRQLQRTQTLQRNRNTRGQLQGQIMGTVGVAFAAAAPIKAAIEFEQSIAKLGAITNADKEAKDKLEKSAKKLGQTTQFTASEAASAMTFLGMAGFNTNKILTATPGILNLAQAAGADLASTADAASNILSGFNLEAEQMGMVGDVLAKTMTTSNVNLFQLGETMKYAATSAASAGGSIQEVAAMAGLLGNVGIQGSMAGTAIKAAYLRLSGNKKAKKAVEELGISVSDANGKMKSMPSILKEISAATEYMSETDRLAMTSKIFGMEAASSMIELTKKAGTGELDKYILRINDSMGTAAIMSKKMGATTQGALKRMGSAFESVAISLGSVLLPTIADGADGMAGMLGTLSSLTTTFPLLTKIVVGLTVGLIALKVVTLAGGYAFTFLSDGLVIARGVMDFFRLSTMRANIAMVRQKAIVIGLAIQQKAMAAWTGAVTAAQWAWNVALNANPIGRVVAGVAAFGALAFTVYKNWQPIMDWFKENFAWLGQSVNWIKSIGHFFWAGNNQSTPSHPGNTQAAAIIAAARSTPGTTAPSQHNQIYNTLHISQQAGEDSEQLAQRITDLQYEQMMRLEQDVR